MTDPMTEIAHRTLATNGISLHIAEAGSGPLVVLLHGFPESWYSWRHQLPALAAAGFHAVAPDMRGYGRSEAPPEVESYDQVALAADVAGLVEALGERDAVVVGHDWGAPVAWHTALLHPDRCRAVAALSVPYRGRSPEPPLAGLKKIYGERFFYMLYFQTPGVAEAELEADVRVALRKFIYGASGEAPDNAFLATKKKGDTLLTGMIDPETGRWFDDTKPIIEGIDWLTDGDLKKLFEDNALRIYPHAKKIIEKRKKAK